MRKGEGMEGDGMGWKGEGGKGKGRKGEGRQGHITDHLNDQVFSFSTLEMALSLA